MLSLGLSSVMTSPATRLRAPLILLGAPRSGTTLLGRLFAAHPDVAYWEEPRPIWSQGNAWREDDELDESHLTPAIARRIDGCFARFLEASGRACFAEKTPSNLLRVRFIHALYPGARFIHLTRHPASVVASMGRFLERPPDAGRLCARVRETPWRDWPAQAGLAFRGLLEPLWHGGRKPWWGPRPQGWRDRLFLPEPQRLAWQWRRLVETGRTQLSRLPAESWRELRHEDLLADPAGRLAELYVFAGLEACGDLIRAAAAQVRPGESVPRPPARFPNDWREMVEAECGVLRCGLGYGGLELPGDSS